LKDFSWKKAPIHHISSLKKNPRCQIFNTSSRRSPRIQRDPYVFLFSYMVYHQIWLIFLLASHHFVYTTKLNKRKKTKKKTLVSANWDREEKRKLLDTVCGCTAGGNGEGSTCL